MEVPQWDPQAGVQLPEEANVLILILMEVPQWDKLSDWIDTHFDES